MNKQEFIFVFPQSGGDICIIKNAHEDVVAMAYVSDMMKVSFFTEDESVNDIKPIGVIEEGGEK